MKRRIFLRSGLAVGLIGTLAGCSNQPEDSTETSTLTSTVTDTATDTPTKTATETNTPEQTSAREETEVTPSVNRPTEYRWDLNPFIDGELRNELAQYAEDPVGPMITGHPAFEYETETGRDDHAVDFEAVKLYRDSLFHIIAQEPDTPPMERVVQAFVDESLYTKAKTDRFVRDSRDTPKTYDAQQWKTADTVEESLDLGHGLILSIWSTNEVLDYDEQGAIIREAYKRYHDFDILAWQVWWQRGAFIAGMLYSPSDDKVRTFNKGGGWSGNGEGQTHAEIQNWRVIADPNDEARGDPTRFQHPILFHTDEWDRQGTRFAEAKDSALGMIYSIATERYQTFSEKDDATGIVNHITATTRATEQLTRTLLEYNTLDDDQADFLDIWELAAFAVDTFIKDPSITAVIDTLDDGKYYDGGFAFYEVDDEGKHGKAVDEDSIIDRVRSDKKGEYDNFGQAYDELEEL